MSAGKCAVLTITSGQQYSNIIDAHRQLGDAFYIGLLGVDAQDGAVTYALQVTDDKEPSASSTWYGLNDTANAAIRPPVAGAARTYSSPLPFRGLRIAASSAASVTSHWDVTKFTPTFL